MDHDDDGETSYNTFVDDVAFEPTYSQALLTAAGRNVATFQLPHCRLNFDASSPENPREYPYKPYIARIQSHLAIHLRR